MLVQVLEEEKKTVLFVYEEIQYVVRHGDLVFIMQIKINRSIFSEDTIGYENIDSHSHKKI